MLVLAIALAFTVAAAAGPGTGADKTEKTVKKQTKPRLSDSELATLQHHHDVNLVEIEMGKLAQQRGGPEEMTYAAQLVKDHQLANTKAIKLAKTHGVTLSKGATPTTEVDEAQQAKQMETMERLKSLEGSNFDREFLRAMVDQHSAELGYMSVAIADATAPKLKAHLEQARPTIEKHANHARELLAKMESRDTPAPKSDETTPPGPTPYNPTP